MKPVRDFVFKNFRVVQTNSTHKVGTDGVLLGAWIDISAAETILDIGTGSGVIALMMAQRSATAQIDAIEIQENDATQAHENFRISPWSQRLTLHHCSLQEFKPLHQFDLIVSNPPFFVNSYLPPVAKRSIVRHTGELTFETLIDCVCQLLKPEGRFALILPVKEGEAFVTSAVAKSLHPQRICKFKSRDQKPVERLLIEFSFTRQECIHEQLTLYAHASGEEWSDAYKSLTRGFYLKI